MDAFLYRIKAAQRDLIERCGGIKRVAELTSASKSEVGRWNNGADPDLMTVGAIALLERDCGQALVTAVLAETNGRRLSDPDADRATDISIMTAHAELMRQSAELSHTMAIAISDGHVSHNEATAVDRVAAQMERAASELRASLAVIKSRGGVKAELKVV